MGPRAAFPCLLGLRKDGCLNMRKGKLDQRLSWARKGRAIGRPLKHVAIRREEKGHGPGAPGAGI